MFDKLPDELILYILSFSYSPQSKILCDDILSFVHTKKEILKIYCSRYHISAICLGWLYDDITLFYNANNIVLPQFDLRHMESPYTELNLFIKSLNPILRNKFVHYAKRDFIFD